MISRQNLSKDSVQIISEAALSSPQWVSANFIPLVIVDCKNNIGLSDLIRIHQDTPPGDVKSTWAKKVFNNKYVYLILEFTKPMSLRIVIPFNLTQYPNIVDGIIQTNVLYIQEVEYDDSKSTKNKLNKLKIIIEIPSSTTFPKWNDIFHQAITRKYSKNYTKKIAKIKAKEQIKIARQLWEKGK